MKYLILVTFLLLTACSHSMIMKDCRKVEGDENQSVCKTMKPWE